MPAPPNLHTLKSVVTALEDDIIFGRLKPRERLTEDALMARFKVKRHIVRQALAELETMGIVVREPYRGAMVRDFSVEEVEEVYQLRVRLQKWAAEMIPLPADDALIDGLEELHARYAQSAEANEPRRAYLLDNDFHHMVYGACGNRFLTDIIMHLMWLTAAIRSFPRNDPRHQAGSVREHRAIIDALKATDRDRLATLFTDHMVRSKNAYLETVRFLDPVPAQKRPEDSLGAGLRAVLATRR